MGGQYNHGGVSLYLVFSDVGCVKGELYKRVVGGQHCTACWSPVHGQKGRTSLGVVWNVPADQLSVLGDEPVGFVPHLCVSVRAGT